MPEESYCLELYLYNPDDSHDLSLSHSQKASDLNLPTSVWSFKCQAKLPILSYYTTEGTEDECLYPMRLIKEYIAKTKDWLGQSEKLFVTRKMGPAVAVSNGTTTSWLKETLTVDNINEPQLGQSQKLVTGLTLSQYMGTTSDVCLERYWSKFWTNIS